LLFPLHLFLCSCWFSLHPLQTVVLLSLALIIPFLPVLGWIFCTFFFLGVGWDWVHLVPTNWPIVPGPNVNDDDDDECGAVGGMRIDKGNWSTWGKPAPVPLCSPQIPHGLTWARTRAAVVGSRWLTAWAMVWPFAHGLPCLLLTYCWCLAWHTPWPCRWRQYIHLKWWWYCTDLQSIITQKMVLFIEYLLQRS
jgi:hypothetical protein